MTSPAKREGDGGIKPAIWGGNPTALWLLAICCWLAISSGARLFSVLAAILYKFN